MKDSNCWLPWADTLAPKQRVASAADLQALVIIPTAGNDLQMLESCISSVQRTARATRVHINVILCPSTPRKARALKTRLGTRAEVHSLAGRFNYCRSINHGISARQPQDRYILFMNDDAFFAENQGIDELRRTLQETSWACVGPYILFNPDVHDDTWPAEKSSARIDRQAGAVRTNAPVSGSCALWDAQWLDRIGPLDEEYGVGWGMDEADMCLRALRRGGRYGRQDSVAIRHRMHASFGLDYTKYTGAAHMRSLRYFQHKFGDEVEEWGRSHHWFPLPGVMVVAILADDLKENLETLDRIESSMDGLRWALAAGTSTGLIPPELRRKVDVLSADYGTMVALCKVTHSRKEVGSHFRIITDAAKHLHSQYPGIHFIRSANYCDAGEIGNMLYPARDAGDPFVVNHATVHTLRRRQGQGNSTREAIADAIQPQARALFHVSLVPDVCTALDLAG